MSESGAFEPFPGTAAETFIQWKGTNVCMDVYCRACGCHFHIDADFAYFVRCPRCRKVYEVGTQVKLTEVEEASAWKITEDPAGDEDPTDDWREVAE